MAVVDVRQGLKACLPISLRRQMQFARYWPLYVWALLRAFFFDMWRYYASASKGYQAVLVGKRRSTELMSWIVADTHKIEKALSLREPRPGFGAVVVSRLLTHLEEFTHEFGEDRTVHWALNVLTLYLNFNEQNGVVLSEVRSRLNDLKPKAGDVEKNLCEGGVVQVRSDQILNDASIDLEKFFNSRYSIRNFAETPVRFHLIEKAVAMSRKTPSVCNRQSWKVYSYLDDETKNLVLRCQQGNRGFGETAGGVLVVTSNLSTFISYTERNQAWIDGGMFAMSLVYALHSLGIGTCCLNWCVEKIHDRELRKITGIPPNEVVIMLIAVGHLPEEFAVAQSPRKPVVDLIVNGSKNVSRVQT